AQAAAISARTPARRSARVVMSRSRPQRLSTAPPASGRGLGEVEDALAAVALHEAPAVADLDHHLRPHPVVARPAVPLPLPLVARPLEQADAGHGPVRVALADALELGHHAARQQLLQAGDARLELRDLLGDGRLLPLPAGLLGGIALVEVLEPRALGRQIAAGLVQAPEGGERHALA